MAVPPAAARPPDRCSGLAVCHCGAAGTYNDRRSERRCPGETARTVAPSRARRQRRCDRTHNPPGSRRREAAPGSPPLPPPFRAGVPLLAPRVLCAPRDTPESRSGRSCPWSSHCAQRLPSYSNESELSRRTLPPRSQRLHRPVPAERENSLLRAWNYLLPVEEFPTRRAQLLIFYVHAPLGSLRRVQLHPSLAMAREGMSRDMVLEQP